MQIVSSSKRYDNTMSIKWKLITSFGALLFLFIVFGTIITDDIANVQKQFRFVIEHDAPVIANANQLLKLVVDMETGQRGFGLTQKEEFLVPYDNAKTKFQQLLKIEKELVSDNPGQLAVLAEIGDLVAQWHRKAAVPEIIKAREIAGAKNRNEEYKAMSELANLLQLGTGKAIIDEIREKFGEFLKVETQLTKKRYAIASQKTSNSRKTSLVLIILSGIFGYIITTSTIYSITSSVNRLMKGTEIIACGNLNHRIEIESADEIGNLTASFNRMVDNLQKAESQVNTEIKERKLVEEDLTRQKQRLSYILEGTNVGTWEWDVQTGEAIFNECWASIIGYNLEELSPVSIDTWIRLAHPDDLKASGELLEKNFTKELDYYEFEARMKHKNGNWVWVLDRGKVMSWTDEGRPILMCGTHQDITDRKKSEDKIRYLATIDPLTELPNLRVAMDRISEALKRAKRNEVRMAILFIDLDGFKEVNDSHGHDAGDNVLKQIANRLISRIRESDTVARIGGDEFVVVLTEINTADNAAEVANKVIQAVSQPITFKGLQLGVGASIGIALFPTNGNDAEQLLKQADGAMYATKTSGKNGYSFAENKS